MPYLRRHLTGPSSVVKVPAPRPCALAGPLLNTLPRTTGAGDYAGGADVLCRTSGAHVERGPVHPIGPPNGNRPSAGAARERDAQPGEPGEPADPHTLPTRQAAERTAAASRPQPFTWPAVPACRWGPSVPLRHGRVLVPVLVAPSDNPIKSRPCPVVKYLEALERVTFVTGSVAFPCVPDGQGSEHSTTQPHGQPRATETAPTGSPHHISRTLIRFNSAARSTSANRTSTLSI